MIDTGKLCQANFPGRSGAPISRRLLHAILPLPYHGFTKQNFQNRVQTPSPPIKPKAMVQKVMRFEPKCSLAFLEFRAAICSEVKPLQKMWGEREVCSSLLASQTKSLLFDYFQTRRPLGRKYFQWVYYKVLYIRKMFL